MTFLWLFVEHKQKKSTVIIKDYQLQTLHQWNKIYIDVDTLKKKFSSEGLINWKEKFVSFHSD